MAHDAEAARRSLYAAFEGASPAGIRAATPETEPPSVSPAASADPAMARKYRRAKQLLVAQSEEVARLRLKLSSLGATAGKSPDGGRAAGATTLGPAASPGAAAMASAAEAAGVTPSPARYAEILAALRADNADLAGALALERRRASELQRALDAGRAREAEHQARAAAALAAQATAEAALREEREARAVAEAAAAAERRGAAALEQQLLAQRRAMEKTEARVRQIEATAMELLANRQRSEERLTALQRALESERSAHRAALEAAAAEAAAAEAERTRSHQAHERELLTLREAAAARIAAAQRKSAAREAELRDELAASRDEAVVQEMVLRQQLAAASGGGAPSAGGTPAARASGGGVRESGGGGGAPMPSAAPCSPRASVGGAQDPTSVLQLDALTAAIAAADEAMRRSPSPTSMRRPTPAAATDRFNRAASPASPQQPGQEISFSWEPEAWPAGRQSPAPGVGRAVGPQAAATAGLHGSAALADAMGELMSALGLEPDGAPAVRSPSPWGMGSPDFGAAAAPGDARAGRDAGSSSAGPQQQGEDRGSVGALQGSPLQRWRRQQQEQEEEEQNQVAAKPEQQQQRPRLGEEERQEGDAVPGGRASDTSSPKPRGRSMVYSLSPPRGRLGRSRRRPASPRRATSNPPQLATATAAVQPGDKQPAAAPPEQQQQQQQQSDGRAELVPLPEQQQQQQTEQQPLPPPPPAPQEQPQQASVPSGHRPETSDDIAAMLATVRSQLDECDAVQGMLREALWEEGQQQQEKGEQEPRDGGAAGAQPGNPRLGERSAAIVEKLISSVTSALLQVARLQALLSAPPPADGQLQPAAAGSVPESVQAASSAGSDPEWHSQLASQLPSLRRRLVSLQEGMASTGLLPAAVVRTTQLQPCRSPDEGSPYSTMGRRGQRAGHAGLVDSRAQPPSYALQHARRVAEATTAAGSHDVCGAVQGTPRTRPIAATVGGWRTNRSPSPQRGGARSPCHRAGGLYGTL